jgi:hypothetical protein
MCPPLHIRVPRSLPRQPLPPPLKPQGIPFIDESTNQKSPRPHPPLRSPRPTADLSIVLPQPSIRIHCCTNIGSPTIRALQHVAVPPRSGTVGHHSTLPTYGVLDGRPLSEAALVRRCCLVCRHPLNGADDAANHLVGASLFSQQCGQGCQCLARLFAVLDGQRRRRHLDNVVSALHVLHEDPLRQRQASCIPCPAGRRRFHHMERGGRCSGTEISVKSHCRRCRMGHTNHHGCVKFSCHIV